MFAQEADRDEGFNASAMWEELHDCELKFGLLVTRGTGLNHHTYPFSSIQRLRQYSRSQAIRSE